MTKEERLKQRLKYLHSNFKESGSKVYAWTVVDDTMPNDARLVDIWIRQEGKDKFGKKGRYTCGLWLDEHGNIIYENVYSWRDYE